MAGPVDIDPAKPHAFLSYTRFDDKVLSGGISALREALEQLVQARTGKRFNIFQDVDDIKPGDAWQKKLDRAIQAAQLFIPILTPSFFESDFCRGEAEAFLDYEARAGREDLVLPIYLIDTPKLDDAEQRVADALASRLHERQYDDWRKLRFELRHDDTRPRIDELAGAIASAIARNGKAATPPPKPSTDVENRLAALEIKLGERDQAIAAERSRREQLEKDLAREMDKARELAEAPSAFEGQIEEAKKRESLLRDENDRLKEKLTTRENASAKAATNEGRPKHEEAQRSATAIPRSLYLGGAVLALLVGAGGWVVGQGGLSSSDLEELKQRNEQTTKELELRTAELDKVQNTLADLQATAAQSQDNSNQVAELTERIDALSAQLTASEQAVAAKESELEEVKQALAEAQARAPSAGETFKDCDDCPEMVVIPAGSFMMGSPEGKGYDDERPQHEVTIAKPFAIGKYEVTFSEWDACVAAGGCDHKPDDEGWGRGTRPVINVSWLDAQHYVDWLSRETGEVYRLPSEAEWEYAARAFPISKGANPPAYAFGDSITEEQSNFGRSIGKTVDVGAYPANDWGLHDMHGNVWEWVEDSWHETYDDAPADGRSWLGGNDSLRVFRGGSWVDYPVDLRSAFRFRNDPDKRLSSVGFRVSRTLTP